MINNLAILRSLPAILPFCRDLNESLWHKLQLFLYQLVESWKVLFNLVALDPVVLIFHRGEKKLKSCGL